MRVLSVDLGTSNTVAVLSAHGRAPRVVEVDGSATMPSAVFAGENGQLVVGREAERRADPADELTNSGEVKTSDWSGGGLAGKVYYMDLGNGFGMLFFIANGKPLYGQIFSPLPETPGAPAERQDIASYFDQNVKPGSG